LAAGLAFMALKPLLIIPMALHPTGAASGAVNAIAPPNHPEKPGASLLTRKEIQVLHEIIYSGAATKFSVKSVNIFPLLSSYLYEPRETP